MKATDCPPLLADFIKNKRRVNFLDLIIIKSSFTLLNMLLQCRQVYKENKFRFKFHLILFQPHTYIHQGFKFIPRVETDLNFFYTYFNLPSTITKKAKLVGDGRRKVERRVNGD